jgi:hypothetical protein
MTMEQRDSSTGLAPILAVLGGVLAIAGSVLKWATASAGGFNSSVKGIQGWEGKFTLLCGILMLVAGVSSFFGTTGGKNRLQLSALLWGTGAAGLGIYEALTAKSQAIEGAAAALADQYGVAKDVARETVQRIFDEGQVAVSVDIGLYVVIAGGIIGIVAGILAITSSSARATAHSPAAGLTGWSVPARPPAPPPPPPPPAPEASSAESSSPWAIPEPTEPTAPQAPTESTAPQAPTESTAPPPSPASPWATEAPVSQTTSEGGGEELPEEEPPGEASTDAAPPGGTLPSPN